MTRTTHSMPRMRTPVPKSIAAKCKTVPDVTMTVPSGCGWAPVAAADEATLICGDKHYIRRYAPDRLDVSPTPSPVTRHPSPITQEQ